MKHFFAFLLFVFPTFTFACQTPESYPNLWWQPVPESELASWEIGPQAADRNKNEVVLSKRNELGMLSNFYAASFEFKGRRYASVEGFWQAMKFPENEKPGQPDPRNKSGITWPFTRAQVEQMTAFDAKKAGEIASQNMKKLGITWITFDGEKIDYKGKDQQRHYDLIVAATLAKIRQNPDVQTVLLKTCGLKLLPDHRQETDAPPAYRYFDIAMHIRDQVLYAKPPETVWCLSKHLEDSIVINEQRKPLYAMLSNQRSVVVSERLLQFERDLLPLTELSDVLAWPFQKWGQQKVWCDDVVDMSETPHMQSAPNPDRPKIENFLVYDLVALQKRLSKALRTDGFAGLEKQALEDLEFLSTEPRYHCMTRHFLESIIRFVRKAEGSTKWLTYLSVLAQIRQLEVTFAIDQLAMPIQTEGVEIICRDVPALLND